MSHLLDFSRRLVFEIKLMLVFYQYKMMKTVRLENAFKLS